MFLQRWDTWWTDWLFSFKWVYSAISDSEDLLDMRARSHSNSSDSMITSSRVNFHSKKRRGHVKLIQHRAEIASRGWGTTTEIVGKVINAGAGFKDLLRGRSAHRDCPRQYNGSVRLVLSQCITMYRDKEGECNEPLSLPIVINSGTKARFSLDSRRKVPAAIPVSRKTHIRATSEAHRHEGLLRGQEADSVCANSSLMKLYLRDENAKLECERPSEMQRYLISWER